MQVNLYKLIRFKIFENSNYFFDPSNILGLLNGFKATDLNVEYLRQGFMQHVFYFILLDFYSSHVTKSKL